MGTVGSQESVNQSFRSPASFDQAKKRSLEFWQWVKQRQENFIENKQTPVSNVLSSRHHPIVEEQSELPQIGPAVEHAGSKTNLGEKESGCEKDNVLTSEGLKDHISPAVNAETFSSLANLTNVLIWGTILQQHVKLLVDTGAAVTVISDKFFNEVLRTKYSMTQNQQFESIKTANGNTVAVTGAVSFSVTIGNLDYVCDAVVVPNLSYNVVLGRDFLHKFNAIIDVRGHKVTFSEQNTVFFAVGDSPPIVSDVRAAKTFVIEGHSEVVIPAFLTSFPSEPVIGLIEAVPKLSDRYHLLGAPSLSKPNDDGMVTFRMCNPFDDPVLLHRGTTIGKFSETSPADEIHPLQNNPKSPPISALGSSPAALKELGTDQNNVSLNFRSLPSPALSTDENTQLKALLEEYSDIFASSSLDLGHTSIVRHEIDTGTAAPIKQAAYRVSQSQKADIEEHIKNMLDQGIIEVSSSPWSSPVVLVKKKDGGTRFCIDYRKLNAVTRKDSYPLPRIDDALDSLAGSKYFSTLDLQSGYHQVAMHPDSKEKTAFISHAGLYHFNVLSFGLTNAPPQFQRLMSRILHGLEWKICLVYIDDVIIFSADFKEHLTRLKLVFDRLREANLKLKPSKCHFACESVNYLGFVVSLEGISPDPKKLEAVKSFPTPRSVKDVRSFLGLCNYYRRFVQGFANIASPLNHLTRKNIQFVWTPECETAFAELKERLCSPPILAYPDFRVPFHLYTDASQFAIGFVLGQVLDGKEVVLAYGGRELSVTEKRYSTTEREALAVVEGIKKYQPYLTGNKFFVHTDHGSLSWLMKVRDPTGRLARWALRLQQYDFDIIHRSGTSNGNADALSRRTYASDQNSEVPDSSPLQYPVAVIDHPCPKPETLYKLQREDADLIDLINYLELSQLPHDDRKARSLLLSIDSFYLDENGILCHLCNPGKRRVQSLFSQIVIPASLRHEVLVACHDDPTAGHLGITKTYEKIRDRYYWNNMFRDIEHWCKSCVDCAMKKIPRGQRKAPLLPIPVQGAFDRVAMDILGPFPPSHDGNRYIIVFSDYYTRWPEAYALPSTEAPRIARLIVDEILARHGAPRTLLSDRGPNFLASIVKEVCKIMNTRRLHTTAYHPQTDGLVERFNGTLAEGLSMYVSTHQKDWDKHLPLILFAYRVSLNATTGESPFYLLYGREPRLPIDATLILPDSNVSSSVSKLRAEIVKNLEEAQHIAVSNTQLAQQKMKEYYDQKSAPTPYEIGSRVWVYTPKKRKGLSKKLQHNYHGPYRIVAKLSPVHFRLRTLDNRPVSVPVHANRLKPYHDPADRPIESPNVDLDSPDLQESDLPADSFESEQPEEPTNATNADVPEEPIISRPEETFTPQEIKDI